MRRASIVKAVVVSWATLTTLPAFAVIPDSGYPINNLGIVLVSADVVIAM